MTQQTVKIHPTAIVDESAVLASGVEIGPYSIIGANVEIGENTWVGPHVVIKGHTKIGKNNKFFQFGSIGEDCQDLKYAGEETYLEIGDGNTFRESCTIHRGTTQDKSLTKIGSHCLFMVNAHVAHDCIIGDHCILANNATLAGHVELGNNVIFGGMSAIHQFSKIGEHAMIGGCSAVNKDVPPYVMASGNYAEAHGINSVGLKRRGFSSAQIMSIKRAFKIICRNGNTLEEAKALLEEMVKEAPEVQPMLDFISTNTRGIVR